MSLLKEIAFLNLLIIPKHLTVNPYLDPSILSTLSLFYLLLTFARRAPPPFLCIIHKLSLSC